MSTANATRLIDARRAWAVLFLILLGLGVQGCGRQPTATSEPAPTRAVPVRIAEVQAGPALPPVRAHGVVMVKDLARLSFKVGGLIAAIEVEAGDQVRKGQTLARIELTEVGSATEQAAQMAEKAQRDMERGERLYRDQVITLEQVQDLRTQAAMAQAGLRSARFNQRYAVIEAPFDGVVLRKLAQTRELVTAGQPVLALGRQSAGFVVQVAVSDRDIVHTRIGDAVQAQLDAYPGQTFAASVSEVASAADERTGLFVVEAQLQDAPETVKSGLVAKLIWQPGADRSDTLAYVPFSAIVDGHGQTARVYVLSGGKAERRTVQVAFIDRTRVALSSGVSPGETVIAEGAQFVSDGVTVSVRSDDETVQMTASLQPQG